MLNILTAQIVFLTYGSTIIEKTGTSLTSATASIFMGVVQLLATFATYKLIDSKGRKFLLILSLVGCALSHAILIAYMQLNSHADGGFGFQKSVIFQFTPVLCMGSVIFMSSIGIVPLTFIVTGRLCNTCYIYFTCYNNHYLFDHLFICTAESFPNKIRPFGMTLGNIILNSFAFLLFKTYPSLEEKIGLQACLIIFLVSSTLGTIYVAIFVEETKGKELNDDTNETNETDETASLHYETPRLPRHEMRRLSRHRLSQHHIEPLDVRKYSVVSFA